MKSSNSFRRSPGGFVAAIFACACFLPAVYAVDPDRVMSQYVHDQWSTEQGFPRGPVYAIAQTGDGYLWIATEAGLIRFDGWNFRVIKDDSGMFTMGGVLGLTTDDNGCLWLRLQDSSVVRYCKGVFDRPPGAEDLYRRIEAMSRSYRGEVLFWKSQKGAVGFRGGNLEDFVSASELPPSPVTSIVQTRDGDVWMGTRDGGLFRDDHGKTVSIRSGLPDLKVNCLLSYGEQSLWVGTDDGVVRWDGTKITDAGLPVSLGHFQALALVADRDGNVWVGTDSRGLLRINSHGVEQFQTSDGSSPRAVTALFEDREGNLWIGHADGIERLRDSAFVTFSAPEGLPTDGSNPVFVDSENRMWFPPVTGGLWWVKDGQRGHVTFGGLSKDVVYSIAGGKGEIWVGRQRGGLSELRINGDGITGKTYTQADGLAQNSIYSVYLSPDGTVWAGTLSAGVSRLRNGKFTNFTVEDGLASNTVVSMLEGRHGSMWFATPNGLSALTGEHWTTYGRADGLPSENVNCLLEDSAGVLWVGTASGIAFWDRGAFHVPASVPAPLRAQILGMAEGKFGSLWMATSGGVLRVRRQKLFDGSLGDGEVREFGLADGLRGLEGVKRHRSVVADSTGRIWFSLNRGISLVDPARLTRDAAPALPQVQSISADGEAIRMGPAMRIAGGHQRITFVYSGLSLSIPDRVRYRYRLEGFDRDWSQPVTARETVYTNLPPGHYRFVVQATNLDGTWSEAEGTAAFEVDPTYWQTWWFRISILFACGAAALAFYRLRLRQLTQRLNMRFEERLAERTRIAQELHDTLLQGFLSASMQLHVAADVLPADSQAKPIMTRALERMGQVIEEGRNAVRGLRSSKSASLDLENAFWVVRQEIGPLEKDDVEFRVIVDGEQRGLHPLLRDEVYRIAREALVNAFRHSHASHIEVELKYSNQFQVFVRDDGTGIDPKIIETGRDGHWGLTGMQERADRIGARLHVFTSASAGTEIQLQVPGRIAFQQQSGRKWKWGRNQHRSKDSKPVSKG